MGILLMAILRFASLKTMSRRALRGIRGKKQRKNEQKGFRSSLGTGWEGWGKKDIMNKRRGFFVNEKEDDAETEGSDKLRVRRWLSNFKQ